MEKEEALNSKDEKIFYTHLAYNNGKAVGTVPIPEELESVGTRKLFDYAGMFLPVLDDGGVLFIDEFDSSLHPLIIESIVSVNDIFWGKLIFLQKCAMLREGGLYAGRIASENGLASAGMPCGA